MHLIEFTDGSSTTELVGKKSAFIDAADFLKQCKGEFEWKFEDIDFEITAEDVQDGAYCRYYPRMPEDFSHLELESGYTFCDPGKGAFEVYFIPWQKLRNERIYSGTKVEEVHPQ